MSAPSLSHDLTTFAGSDKLRNKPLVPTGALDPVAYPRTELTPALGLRFDKGVKLKEILGLPTEERDGLLHDLVILGEWWSTPSSTCRCEAYLVVDFAHSVSQSGVVFFQEQDDIVPKDIGRLALLLGELAGKPDDSTLHMSV